MRKAPADQRSSARRLISRLAGLYDPEAPLTDPLEIVLWDNIGYLIDDDKRRSLLAEFRALVGIDAAAIARAPDALLLDIARRGGMQPEARVERWRRIAGIVLTRCNGDLKSSLKELPAEKARALLKEFPSIGEPGADRILLFAGRAARASVESNGLRVLVRFGAVPDLKTYAAAYRAAASVLAEAAAGKRQWLVLAWGLLRAHGQSLCKRTQPHCLACPLDGTCAHQHASWF